MIDVQMFYLWNHGDDSVPAGARRLCTAGTICSAPDHNGAAKIAAEQLRLIFGLELDPDPMTVFGFEFEIGTSNFPGSVVCIAKQRPPNIRKNGEPITGTMLRALDRMAGTEKEKVSPLSLKSRSQISLRAVGVYSDDWLPSGKVVFSVGRMLSQNLADDASRFTQLNSKRFWQFYASGLHKGFPSLEAAKDAVVKNTYEKYDLQLPKNIDDVFNYEYPTNKGPDATVIYTIMARLQPVSD